MSAGNLATAVTVVFVVSVVVLVAELLFVLFRRHSFRPPHSSQPPTSGDDSTSYYSAKEWIYFFLCLKSQTRVEPSEAPKENPDGYSPEDPVIDVFKLLETNGRSRILCTIKEDDGEEVESVSMIPATEKVSLQACLQSEAAAERAAKVDGEVDQCTKKTVLIVSPCDSPMFFTPIGSPSPRDGMDSEFVSSVSGNSCGSGR